MKEQLIDFLKYIECNVEEMDDNLISISCDGWAGDVLLAEFDEGNNMISFTNPEFYEVSRWDVEEVTRVFSTINDANVPGRVRVFYQPTDRDTFAVSATANLMEACNEEIIADVVPKILMSLVLAHTDIVPEFGDKIYEKATEILAKAGSDCDEECEEEIKARDNNQKYNIVCETLKEMQCISPSSDSNMIDFIYQGMKFCLCIDGGDGYVTLYSGLVDSFDISDIEYFSKVRKVVNYLNSESEAPVIYVKDDEGGNICKIISTASLRCTEKVIFKENLLRFIDSSISTQLRYIVTIGLLTGSKGIKENYMLNYDL